MKGGLLLALLSFGGCKSVPALPDSTLAALTAGGSFLQGPVSGLHPARVLNDVDFVYDAQFSPDARQVALSRLGMKSFDVLLWGLQPTPKKLWETPVNLHAFDVENVAFSPDGQWIAAVSRDGSVRLFAANTGAPAGAWLTEEPLVTVAFHPGGRYLVVGSEGGLLTALALDPRPPRMGLRFSTELKVHAAQVRGLAFAPDGRLFSASWDKSVAVLSTGEKLSSAHAAAVHFERKSGFAALRGTLNDAASVLFALDVRMPQVLVMRSSLAQAVGLEPSRLTDTMEVKSSFGTQIARVAHGVRLSFKGLKLSGLDAVICDACIPAEAQAVLGQGFNDTVELAFDDTLGQALLKRRVGVEGPGEPLLMMNETRRFTFPAFLNDLSIDHAGKVLGLAFSETRAERTREVYQREKHNEVEPERPWDIGARVDAQTGAVLQTYRGHHGVVATAAISPDGLTLATGGWDKTVQLQAGPALLTEPFGWAVRRVRFSPDGRWLAVAAWTPQNPLGNFKSDRSAVVWELAYAQVQVLPR